MTNFNDHKIVAIKSKKYFNILKKELEVTENFEDIEKQRYGFYILMLELITGEKDTETLVNMITDKEFNTKFFNQKFDDFGIDAIHIDKNAKSINLFNFKYRKDYNKDKMQSENESTISNKFFNFIYTQTTEALSGKLKEYAKEIIKLQNGDELWDYNFFIVSNESIEISEDNSTLASLRNMFSLKIKSYGLETIKNKISIRPEKINGKLHLDKDCCFPFSEDSMSSSKSYIVRVNASDLIRLTCDNETYRNDYALEEYEVLQSIPLNYNILFDNVRGLVLKSKFNKNMETTLEKEPKKFFLYNNGITMIAEDLKVEYTNGGKKVKIEIEGMQIVNGGQTLRTLHDFNQKNKEHINSYLTDCQILLRIFKINKDDKIKNTIAEYTNSQNTVSQVDLKALRDEQIQIEQLLDEYNIIYARKSGDTGIKDDKEYEHKIGMEKLGQILYSIQGSPEQASNKKKEIFDSSYEEIFIKKLDLHELPSYIKTYYSIKEEYKKTKEKYSEQKAFYILYIFYKTNESIPNIIEKLEKYVEDFVAPNVTNAKKLTMATFKDEIKNKFNIL